MASIGAASIKSVKSALKHSQVSTRGGASNSKNPHRVSQIKEKVTDMEQNIIAMKENINRQHNQSVTSEKHVVKAVNSNLFELSSQLTTVKDSITRLAEVMVEEFESVRMDF